MTVNGHGLIAVTVKSSSVLLQYTEITTPDFRFVKFEIKDRSNHATLGINRYRCPIRQFHEVGNHLDFRFWDRLWFRRCGSFVYDYRFFFFRRTATSLTGTCGKQTTYQQQGDPRAVLQVGHLCLSVFQLA